MKNQELFERTVNILVDAYQKGTLKHRDCKACAVGNIVAANCGIEDVFSLQEWREKAHGLVGGWSMAFVTHPCGTQSRSFVMMELYEAIRLQIGATGYPVEVLADIEFAFEKAAKYKDKDEDMLNGLYAVYDVLCNYHEVECPVAGELVFIKDANNVNC
jgi:hypothetical protein